MNWFKFFTKPKEDSLQQKNFSTNNTDYKNFGRFCDALTEPESTLHFNEALKQFDANNFTACFKSFFNFLTNKQGDNIIVDETSSGLNFEIIQGSKKIEGIATPQKFYCLSRIVRVDVLEVRYLRQIMEANFAFMHCRFALDTENNIILLFETVSSEASPYKLLDALRELAIHADKNDDLLLNEFKEELKPLDLGLRKALSPTVKNFYTQYLVQQIDETFQYMSENPILETQYPGGISYLLLALAYQFDYLLAPQGFITDAIERIERLFFEKSEESFIIKNKRISDELKFIKECSPEIIASEFYKTSSTFSILPVKSIDSLVNLIQGELPNMNWYTKNGFQKIGLAVTDFIVGNAQFNNAFPELVRKLLHLYAQVRHFNFFVTLGLNANYKTSNGILIEREIKSAIQKILIESQIPKKQTDKAISELNFSDEVSWSRAYLEMISNLDFQL